MGIFIEELDNFEEELRDILKKRQIDVDDLVEQIKSAVKRNYKFRILLSKMEPVEFTHICIGDTLKINWSTELTLVDNDKVEIPERIDNEPK